MALTYVGGNSNTGTGSTITVSLTALTGGSDSSPSTGDIVFVFFGLGAAANFTATLSEQSGNYTHLGTQSRGNDTRDAVVRGAYRVQPATPDTSVVVSGPNNTGYSGWAAVQVWRGVDTSTPLTGTASGASGTNSNHGNPAAITPDVDDAVVICGFAGSAVVDVGNSKTGPSGYTTYEVKGTASDGSGAAGADCYFSVAAKLLSGGGGSSEDPGAYSGGTTSTSDGWATWTAAIAPAPLSVTLTETATLSHSTLKLLGIILMEAMSLADPTVVAQKGSTAYDKELTETASLSHDVLSVTSVGFRDSVSLTDSLTAQKGSAAYDKELTEALGLTDSWERQVGLNLTLTEASTLTDTPSKGAGRDLAEAATLTDSSQAWKSWHYPTELVSTTGVTESGSLVDTWLDDGVELVLTEVTGTPGFDHALRWGTVFSPAPTVPTFKLQLTLKGYYDGNAGHVVRVDQWDFVGSGWVDSGARLTDSVGETTYTLPLLHEARFLSTGRVYVRFYHSSPGNPVHRLHIDELFLSPEERPVETATLTDTLTVSVDRQLTESSTLTDTLTVSAGKQLAELAGLAGTQTFQTSRDLLETVGLSDTIQTQFSGGSQNYTKDLTETALLSDTAAKGTGRALLDSQSLSDVVTKGGALVLVPEPSSPLGTGTKLAGSVRKSLGRDLRESMGLADTLSLTQTQKQLSESLVLSDIKETQAGGNYTKDFPEAAQLTDTFSRQVNYQRTLLESQSLSDTRTKAAGKQRVETVGLADTPRKSTSRTLTEGVALSDTVTETVTYLKEVAETATLADTLTRGAGKQRTEAASLTATPAKGVGRTLTEGLTVADLTVDTQHTPAVGGSYSKTLTDAVGLSDSLTRQAGYGRTLTEAASLLDSLTRQATFARTLTEGAALVATLEKGAGKQRTESLGLTASLTKGPGKQRTETLAVTDVLTRQVAAARVLTEAASLSDIVDAGAEAKTLSESTSLSAAVTKGASKTLTETATLLESFNVPKKLVEGVSLTDTFEHHFDRTKNFLQYATLTDTLQVVYGLAGASRTETLVLGDTRKMDLSRVLTETLAVREAVSAPDAYAVEEWFTFAG